MLPFSLKTDKNSFKSTNTMDFTVLADTSNQMGLWERTELVIFTLISYYITNS